VGDLVVLQHLLSNFSLKFRQRASLVHGDVISFVALDLILWITFGGVMHVTFVLHVVRVFLDNNAFNVSGFGVPSDMVSDSELLYHSRSFQGADRSGLPTVTIHQHMLKPTIKPTTAAIFPGEPVQHRLRPRRERLGPGPRLCGGTDS
jgi:hypothetical protein